MNNLSDALNKMVGRRRNSRGYFGAALIALGMSVAALGLYRRNGQKPKLSLQKIINNFRAGTNAGLTPATAANTEFANELTPAKDLLTKK
nr:hypothetical protein [uncultured Bacillus sp.]